MTRSEHFSEPPCGGTWKRLGDFAISKLRCSGLKLALSRDKLEHWDDPIFAFQTEFLERGLEALYKVI